MQREKFGSRLGFILISAGCAIGLGNVWRFPYIVGKYGGAAFIMVYLLFLIIFGLPIMAIKPDLKSDNFLSLIYKYLCYFKYYYRYEHT